MLWRGETIAVPSFEALAQSHAYGREWYRESGESVTRYAESRGLAPQYVADVVAILSPRVTVAQNIKLAKLYLETGKAPGAMKARLTALARYESSGVFNGPKVNAFSAALMGDGGAVVVDAWMYRLANEPRRTAKSYRDVSSWVASIADALGWPNAETQAALWCGARSLCGFGDSYSPLMMEG